MEQSDANYVVPKRTIGVEIGEARGSLRAELFLAQYRDHDARPQGVADLLEGERHFLPVRQIPKGEVRIVNRAAIVWLKVPTTEDSEEDLGRLFDCRNRVRVVTDIGVEFEGDLLYDAPDGQARVVDYANRPNRFLRLHLEEAMLFVNKDHIVELRDLGADES